MPLKFEPRTDPAVRPLPPDRKQNRAGRREESRTGIPIRNSICVRRPRKLLGVDVAQIPGSEENALQLFREVRPRRVQVDRRRALVPWLALCPDNNISDGKLLWRGIRRVKTAPVISFA